MMKSGLSAMIRLAAALELEDGVLLETISIGSPKNSLSAYCEWEGAGTFLMYTISIVGSKMLVSVSLLDSISEPQVLLRIPDVEASWVTAFNLICSLEKYRVQDLTRPITINGLASDGSDSWIIA